MIWLVAVTVVLPHLQIELLQVHCVLLGVEQGAADSLFPNACSDHFQAARKKNKQRQTLTQTLGGRGETGQVKQIKVFLLLHVRSQLDRYVLVFLTTLGNQLWAAETTELGGGHAGSKGFTYKRVLLKQKTRYIDLTIKYSKTLIFPIFCSNLLGKVITNRGVVLCFLFSFLTWHGHHGSSSPEDIHACCVTIAQRGVEAYISQLASPHMLLLGCHGRENDARGRQTHVLSVLLDVGLANSREAKKPQHAVGHTLQDLQQHGKFQNKLDTNLKSKLV